MAVFVICSIIGIAFAAIVVELYCCIRVFDETDRRMKRYWNKKKNKK